MNIIIPIAGGIGKCIAGTAFIKAVKKQYPNSKIIVSSPYPTIFKHHPDISETILIDPIIILSLKNIVKIKNLKFL